MEQYVRSEYKNFCKVKLKKNKYRIKSCNNILALKWKDKQNVYILSSKYEWVEMSESNIDSIVLRNQNVIEYNKGITGIDRLDQILACFPVMRKCMKRYRKIFFYLFNLFCLTPTFYSTK